MTTKFKHSPSFRGLTTEANLSCVPTDDLNTAWNEHKHHSSSGVRTYSPRDQIGEKSQAELADQWWKYIQETPASKNPLSSTNKEFPRFGDIQFLTGNGGTIPPGPITRSIKIDTETSLFAPLVTQQVDPVGLPPEWTEQDSRTVAKAIIDTAFGGYFNLVTEGGVEKSLISNWRNYRQSSPTGGFDFTVPKDSIVGYTPPGLEVENAVQDGYWVGVKPLSAGTYTFHFGATLDLSKIEVDQNQSGNVDTLAEEVLQSLRDFYNSPGVNPLIVQDITYDITVSSKGGKKESRESHDKR